VKRAQKLSPQIDVELVAGQEVFGQRSGVKGPLNSIWLSREYQGMASLLEKTCLVGAQIGGDRMGNRKFHCLTYPIATHLLNAGSDLAFVKDWLGHTNIQNTTIYARLMTATFDA
jgi:site-specific recombinase XerD